MWLSVFYYIWRGWRRAGPTGANGRYFLAALLGSITFFLTSLIEATFADEEVRQLLMFIWAAGLWPYYNIKDTDQEESGAGS
jgi:hypothetical protein